MRDFHESTMTGNSDESASAPAAKLALRWVHPLPAPPPLWLDRSVVLGRDASLDAVLDTPQASRRHAIIERYGPVILLRDLDSKNGVYVNGNRIQTHELCAGDVVRFGDVIAVVSAAPLGSDLGFGDLGDGVFGGYLHAKAFERLRTLAPSGLPLVIEGATGTGKERFAQLAHALSGVRGPFVSVNCSVYNESLAAAELFGHRRGAFTGADNDRSGHIRAAEGGTLFLDELTDLPLGVQPMLLRAIENREVLPLGESRARPINVRFIAASQAPLASAVERGAFRADLWARLEGGLIRLPKLAECREIVPELFIALFRKHAEREPELSAAFVEALCLRNLELNVRGLETFARRMALYGGNERLTVAALRTADEIPAGQRASSASLVAVTAPRVQPEVPGRSERPYTDAEVTALREALARCGGNITQAAAALSISRQRAYRMLAQHKLDEQ